MYLLTWRNLTTIFSSFAKINGREIDHINGDKLDNRKVNLRICTSSQNAMNRKSLGNRFGYKGIVNYRNGKYQAMIWDGKHNLNLGMFTTKEDAAKAYDNAAVEIHGIYARLNFPEK